MLPILRISLHVEGHSFQSNFQKVKKYMIHTIIQQTHAKYFIQLVKPVRC